MTNLLSVGVAELKENGKVVCGQNGVVGAGGVL